MTPKEELHRTINLNYDRYLKYAKNMKNTKDEPCEVLHECIINLYNKKEEKIKKILPFLDWYLIRMIELSNKSNTSSYQQKINKFKNNTREINNKDCEYLGDTENLGDSPDYIFYDITLKDLYEKDFDGLLKYVLNHKNDDDEFEYISNIKKEEIKKFRKNVMNILEEKCTWYQKEVFLRYMMGKTSFGRMSKETGIVCSSLFKTFTLVKNILKSNIYI